MQFGVFKVILKDSVLDNIDETTPSHVRLHHCSVALLIVATLFGCVIQSRLHYRPA